MRGGDRDRFFCRARIDENCGKPRRQRHCGACAVKTYKGYTEAAQTEGAAYALIQKVACKNIVDIIGRQPRFIKHGLNGGFLQLAFSLFKALFTEKAIRSVGVKFI